MVKRILLVPARVAIDAAGAVFRHRAAIIEAIGGACLVAAAATVGAAFGLTVAGVALVLKAAEIDRRTRRS